MANAVKRLFPGTQVTIGPTIEDGFYYDFAARRRSRPKTSTKIEGRERRESSGRPTPSSARRSRATRRSSCSSKLARSSRSRSSRTSSRRREDAHALLARRLGRSSASALTARRPAQSASQAAVGRRRLLARRSARTRCCSASTARLLRQEGLDAYLQAARRGEEARPPQARQGARPVRVPSVRAGRRRSGLPNGTMLYQRCRSAMRRMLPRRTATSRSRRRCSINKALWEKCGHWGKYRENMFLVESEEQTFVVKPMNCPSHHCSTT